MEIMTVGGIALALACVLISILLPGSDMSNYAAPAAILIVVGGTVGSTMACYPPNVLKNMLKIIRVAFEARDVDLPGDVELVVEAANVARREGILALEERTAQMDDRFLKKGIMLIVDGSDPELVRSIMDTELIFIRERHLSGQAVLLQMASFAQAYGMAGTLIGLIAMLGRLGDMTSLGPNMAVALSATLYGIILANAVLTPLAKKLRSMSDEEYLRHELVLEGILSIQNGENPRIIRERLGAFLSRVQVAQGSPAASKAWAAQKYPSLFARQKRTP